MVVFGPINIRGYVEGTTCDVCGRDIEKGEDMYVLRVNGRHLRTCGTECADVAVESAKAVEAAAMSGLASDSASNAASDAEPVGQLA